MIIMIIDKKLKLEMPENNTERMWFNLREKLKMELQGLEEEIKPKNRIKQLEKTRQIIEMNKELIKTCDNHLKGGNKNKK
jgi:hypothetical protein